MSNTKKSKDLFSLLIGIASFVMVLLSKIWFQIRSNMSKVPAATASSEGPEMRQPRDHQTTTRFVFFMLAFILLLSIGGSIFLRRFTTPPTPVLAPIPTTVNEATLTLRGLTAPRAKVIISVTGLSESTTTEADADGIFQAVVVFPKAGDYDVSARAQDAGGALSPPSPSIPFKYDPSWSPAGLIRKVTAYVSYRKVRFDLEAIVPRMNEDKSIAKLITDGPANASVDGNDPLLNRLLQDFRFNKVDIVYWFRKVTPQVTFSEKAITIRATSQTEGDPPFYVFNGLVSEILELELPRDKGDDTYVFLLSDYEINRVKPLPGLSLNKPVGAWSAVQSVASPSPSPSPSLSPNPSPTTAVTPTPQLVATPGPITVNVVFRPLANPGNLLKLLRVPPGEITLVLKRNENWRDMIRLLRSLLVIVPIAWMVWLLYANQEKWPNPQLQQRLRHFSLALLAIALISPFLYLSHPQADAVPGARRFVWPLLILMNSDVARSVAAAFTLALFAAIPLVAFTFLSERTKGKHTSLLWMRDMTGSAWVAAVSVVGISLLSNLFLKIANPNRPSPQKFSEVVALIILLVLLGLIIRLTYAWRSSHKLLLLSLLFVLGAIIAWPFLPADRPERVNLLTLLGYVRTFFSVIQPLLPFIFLIGVLTILYRLDQSRDQDSPHFGLALLIFASYVIGSNVQIFLIPIPLFIALWVFPRQVVIPCSQWKLLDEIRNEVSAKRDKQLLQLLTETTTRQARLRLQEKLIGGDLTRAEYDQKRNEIEDYVAEQEGGDKMKHDYRLRDLLLNFGLFGTNWANGKWSAKHGLILVTPFSVFYVWELLQRAKVPVQPPYRPLYLACQLLIYFTGWYISGFFFGYFFPYLRGKTGLKKGASVAAGAIFCLLPVWVINLSEPIALFLQVAQIFLFFTILGFWAFDVSVLRDELGELFGWKAILKIEDVPSLAAFASVAFGSLGAAANSAMTGQFDTILTQVVKLVFQQLSSLPANIT
jgi:hypothetical protein